MVNKNTVPSDSEQPVEFASTERVPFREKLVFSLGALPDMIGFHAPKNLANPIFNVILGVNPVLIGAAIAIARVWDALVDPTIAALSDNTRGKFGRRKPYIVAGAVLSGIAFAGMWRIPPNLSENGYFLFMIVAMVVFYSIFSVFSVPFHAMGYEMTTDYHDRTRVMSYRLFFNHLGLIAVGWVFAGTQLPIFKDTMDGIKWMGLLLGMVIVVLGVVPGLILKEKTFAETKRQGTLPVFKSVREALQNKAFTVLLIIAFLQIIVTNIASSLGLYVNIYYVYGGEIKGASVIQGWGATFAHIGAMMILPLLSSYSRKVGKHKLLRIAILTLILGSSSKWLFYNPTYPYLQLISILMVSFSSIGFWLMIQSMIGDVCDEELYRLGVRREAMFGALLTWVQKVGISISFVTAGFLLVYIGFDQSMGKDQNPVTVFWLRLLFSGIPAIAGVLSLMAFQSYRLTEVHVQEVRRKLDNREKSLGRKLS